MTSLVLSVAVLSACQSSADRRSTSSPSPSVTSTSTHARTSTTAVNKQRWRHVVVVVLENHSATSIIDNPDAPYLNSLPRRGLSFTDMHGETHPSQANYFALFSGSRQGVAGDSCPHSFAGANLGSQLLAGGFTFTGYAESLPAPGWTGCDAYPYARRHVPWVNFTDLPANVDQPFSAFPSDFTRLPDVAFVVPNVINDMHDGTVAQGDSWMLENLGGYADWARTHDSLLVVTWDEDEDTAANHIATLAVGDGVTPGQWTAKTNHYGILGALEDAFGLARLGYARSAPPVPPLG